MGWTTGVRFPAEAGMFLFATVPKPVQAQIPTQWAPEEEVGA
jgi:hypothetical protein